MHASWNGAREASLSQFALGYRVDENWNGRIGNADATARSAGESSAFHKGKEIGVDDVCVRGKHSVWVTRINL